MAIPFETIRESVLLILYDYMLTSNHDGFWYSVPAVQEALPTNASGAFVQRALDGLIVEKLVEQGGSDILKKDLFALTDHGIRAAEDLLEKKGCSIEDYEPAPESDSILSRINNSEAFLEIAKGLDDLKIEIQRSNSFANESSDAAELVEAEISAAGTLMDAGTVRISRLKSLVVPTLKYLAKKFADQSIGELAKRLISLILGLET
jgi:DNA-binding PadR family transcriptional regulator